MSNGISGFFTNYQFLDFTKGIAQDQIELGKQPTETWAQIGNTLRRVCWNNTRTIFYTGLDITAYLAASALRSQGFCLPPLSAPPARPYHDDAQFLKCAVERGLWTWGPKKRAEMEEAIESCLSDEYNVFAVIGEFCLAYFYENNQGKKYIPSFLRASESLENNESFQTIGNRFAKLNSLDKRNILEALYNQKEPKHLSSAAKQVHRDIRALASKLQQGNKGYLEAFQAYSATQAQPSEVAGPQLSTPVRRMPVPPSIPPRAMPIPSAPPREMPIPSAPPGGPNPMAYQSPDMQMAETLAFVRRSLSLGCEELKRQIVSHERDGGYSSKHAVAGLMVIRALRDKLAGNPQTGVLTALERAHPRLVTRVVQAFAGLSASQFNKLIQGNVTPQKMIPSDFMPFYHDMQTLAETLLNDPVFDQVFAALKIDLLAS